MGMRIKSVSLNGEKTVVKYRRAEQKRGYNEVVEDEVVHKSDLIRTKKFTEAFYNMSAHLAIALGIDTAFDTTGVLFDIGFFNKGEWRDNPRFKNFKLTSVIIAGKEAADGIILVGTIETPSKELAPLRTNSISLTKGADGAYTYELLDILSSQFDDLEMYAEKWIGGETGATAVQSSIDFAATGKVPATVKKMTPSAEKTTAAIAVN